MVEEFLWAPIKWILRIDILISWIMEWLATWTTRWRLTPLKMMFKLLIVPWICLGVANKWRLGLPLRNPLLRVVFTLLVYSIRWARVARFQVVEFLNQLILLLRWHRHHLVLLCLGRLEDETLWHESWIASHLQDLLLFEFVDQDCSGTFEHHLVWIRTINGII